MPRKGHSEEKIVFALRQVESGKKVADICREMGISEQTFYTWKKRYAGVGVSELRELRQLREENRNLKTLVADLTLDKHILQDVLSKKSEALGSAGTGAVRARRVQPERTEGQRIDRDYAMEQSVRELPRPATGFANASAGIGCRQGPVWL
jgi:putative transposase